MWAKTTEKHPKKREQIKQPVENLAIKSFRMEPVTLNRIQFCESGRIQARNTFGKNRRRHLGSGRKKSTRRLAGRRLAWNVFGKRTRA